MTRPCKDCGCPSMPNCSQCVDCHVKRLWGADWYEMVGRHIEAADRIPFDGDVHDEDYATEAMYRASEDAERDALARDAMARAG